MQLSKHLGVPGPTLHRHITKSISMKNYNAILADVNSGGQVEAWRTAGLKRPRTGFPAGY